MINVHEVSKYYGDFQAVKEVSFSINQGEITGLLGPNGAGKTTTLRMLTGYLKPDGGAITIDEMDALDHPVATKKMIGYLPESAPLYDDMVVLDYLAYVAQVRGVEDPERLNEMVKVCGIAEVMHKTISELSKGYRQRVGLAHALIHDPEILVLDEPTAGLDPNQIIEIRNLIREIGKTKTVILSTHILSEVEAICDRVVIIHRGSVVADDSTSNLQSLAGEGQVVTLSCGAPSTDDLCRVLSSVEGVASCQGHISDDTATASIMVKGERDIRPLLAKTVIENGWDLFELTRRRQSLEAVFRQLTEGGDHASIN